MMLMRGTNELSAETTAATIISNIESMIAQALAAGIRVILGTCVPNDNARPAWGSYLSNLFALNQALRDLAWDTRGSSSRTSAATSATARSAAGAATAA
jgi:hypothetical protein